MFDYVSSKIFVGRNKEQDAVHSFILSDNNSRLLCIYSTGEGGFGKTQLLLQVRAAYRQEERNIVVGHQLIDFYHLDMQRKMGVIEALAKQLDLTESLHLIAEYRQKSISSEDDEYIEQLFKKFSAEYHDHVSGNKERTFVFLFDSYEHIQRIIDKEAHSTDHSRWLETKLIPLLINQLNVRVILAGRYLPTELPTELVPEKPIELKPFSEVTSENFLREALEKRGGIALKEMQELYRLTDGHPIRLALAADWLRHASDPVKKLLAGIEPGKTFESRLIKYIRQQLEKDESFFISSYIAIAYQRLNADILHHLTGEKREDCERYIDQMGSWSFIKPKGEDSVILHDVMHSLFDEYIKSEDPGFYRDNLELLLEYYKKVLFGEEQTLPEEEQEQYILEMVNYGFQLDFDQGVERFCTIFDQVMEDGKYHFASNFLLKAAEDLQFRYKGKSKTLNFLKIDARIIEYDIETAEAPAKGLARANRIIEQYKDDERWNGSEIEGLIQLKKGTALFYLGRFQKAINTFRQAKRILLHSDAGINAHWATSWTGYTHYQLGELQRAEEELNRSRELFYQKAVDELKRIQVWDEDIKNQYRQILQGYQISLVNLSLVYFATGRLYEAVRHARIYLHINQNLPRNDREIARAQTTLALISWFMGYRLEAKNYLKDAEEKAADESILISRIQTEQLRQRLHESGLLYSFLLESYRAGDLKKQLKEIQSSQQDNKAIFNDELAQDIFNRFERLGITKELLTAYLVQADVLLIRVPEISFQAVEEILSKVLQKDIADDDIQAYEKIQALGNLIRLCYFARAWDTPDAREIAGKFDKYKECFEAELKRLCPDEEKSLHVYPELAARYQIILGNLLFDEAIEEINFNKLHQAIQHYLTAADLLKKFTFFKDHPFYIIRHRLSCFIQHAIQKNASTVLDNYLELQKNYNCSEETGKYFSIVFDASTFCLPTTKIEDIEKKAKELHEERGIQLPEKVIRAKSLTDALKKAAGRLENFDLQRIRLSLLRAMWLMKKGRFYRRMRTGNIDFALGAYNKAEQELKEITSVTKELSKDSVEILSLKGRLAAGRGTVYYRQGSHEELLEFYLKDELESACKEFGEYYTQDLVKAEELLYKGVALLEQAEEKSQGMGDSPYIENFKELNGRWLGATYFRIGEFWLTNNKLEKAKKFLDKAVKQCKKHNYTIRQFDAMESYITVVYCGKEDKQELHEADKLCEEYREALEKKKKDYPFILAKLRITQGDDIFSRFFRRDEKRSKEKGIYQDVRYSLREKYRNGLSDGALPDEVHKSLRRMVIYYVEACSLMKQFNNERSFVATVRIIIRRLRMLQDAPAIEKVHIILREMWNEYPELHQAKEELNTVSEFALIVEGLIKETSEHTHTAAH